MNPVVSPAFTSEELHFTAKVTCSLPFSSNDGRNMIAIGCSEGVWIGLRYEPKSLKRVLTHKNVTQCSLLPDFGKFLVLADKDLLAFELEALVPSGPPGPVTSRAREKINKKDVQFFRVGTVGNLTLLLYMTRKLIESVFYVLEPVAHSSPQRSRSVFGLGGGNKSEWFRPYAEFTVQSETYGASFVNGKLVIHTSKGFEIVVLQSHDKVIIPTVTVRDDRSWLAIAKRLDPCVPLGMFPTAQSNEFLLCYNDFGLHVDRHGFLARGGAITEWEGVGDRVARHAPYFFIFTPRFIEIRELDTCHLVQIISGTDIRCLWDETIGGAPPEVDARRVHAIKRVEPRAGDLPTRGYLVQPFELAPTVPFVSGSGS